VTFKEGPPPDRMLRRYAGQGKPRPSREEREGVALMKGGKKPDNVFGFRRRWGGNIILFGEKKKPAPYCARFTRSTASRCGKKEREKNVPVG